MPNTATLATPGTDTDTRQKLRSAIEQVQETEQRLAALEEAQARAKRQSWQAATKPADAESALRKANSESRQNLAYQYVNNETITVDPVTEARADVDAARKEVDRLEEVQVAILGEIAVTNSNLNKFKTNLYIIMSELVCASPEYQALLIHHKDAWQNLRTVKEAMRAVAKGLYGQLPQRYLDEVSKAQPLEIRVGFDADRAFISQWADALTQLEQDADAELPSNI